MYLKNQRVAIRDYFPRRAGSHVSVLLRSRTPARYILSKPLTFYFFFLSIVPSTLAHS